MTCKHNMPQQIRVGETVVVTTGHYVCPFCRLEYLEAQLEAAERDREAMKDNLKSVQTQLDIANRLLGECEAASALLRDEPSAEEGL